MKLSNAEQAIIPQRKLTEYLLSPTHCVGRAKATFFARFGFTQDAWETSAAALHHHALEYEVASREEPTFSVSYPVESALHAPDGRTSGLRVVWFVETGETIPRLSTAYPLKETGQ
jgi:hypothetical protein